MAKNNQLNCEYTEPTNSATDAVRLFRASIFEVVGQTHPIEPEQSRFSA